ncbi:unnamed protein product [Closterium sp. NIES-64]|nr:unnamed protein product [Closterium sp. NIES-64]
MRPTHLNPLKVSQTGHVTALQGSSGECWAGQVSVGQASAIPERLPEQVSSWSGPPRPDLRFLNDSQSGWIYRDSSWSGSTIECDTARGFAPTPDLPTAQGLFCDRHGMILNL